MGQTVNKMPADQVDCSGRILLPTITHCSALEQSECEKFYDGNTLLLQASSPCPASIVSNCETAGTLTAFSTNCSTYYMHDEMINAIACKDGDDNSHCIKGDLCARSYPCKWDSTGSSCSKDVGNYECKEPSDGGSSKGLITSN